MKKEKKERYKKIPISEFISDKKLSKIEKIINTSESVDIAYDRIESLLSDEFTVKGLGTNRIILLHKKKKFKDLIFKVAGDSHGIEANYREFYNGDLDHCLTFSYSISSNGVFIVQERVQDFDSKMMKEYKKDVRKMLKHLSKKLLLVDCRISNFKNFGIRKNGDVVLLDHGDTVPLPKSQGDKIVNLDEESNVSLRCKRFKDTGASKLKPCDGKLVYDKNFEYLQCERCGAIMNVNDAYREFYGDRKTRANVHNDFINGLDFDPEKWIKKMKQYAQDKMSSVDIINDNEKEKGELNMKEKMINGNKCKQIKGYWIPEIYLNNPVFAMVINTVKVGKVSPKDFLINYGLNPADYVVRIEDHTPNPGRKAWKEQIPVVCNEILKIINERVSNGQYKFNITYKEIEARTQFIVDSIEKEKTIFMKLKDVNNIIDMRYKPDKFSFLIEDPNDITIEDADDDDDYVIDEDRLNDAHKYDSLLGVRNPDEDQDDITPQPEKVTGRHDDIFRYENIDETDDEDEDNNVNDDDESELDNDVIETEEDIDDYEPYSDSEDPTGYNIEYLNDNYDFSLMADEINELINDAPTKSPRPGYTYRPVDIDAIVSIFRRLNPVYDGIFNDHIFTSNFVNIGVIVKFIENVLDMPNLSTIDVNNFADHHEFEFVMVDSTETDDVDDTEYDVSEELDESNDESELDDENINLIDDEQSNDNYYEDVINDYPTNDIENDNSDEEDPEMNERIDKLEQRINSLEQKMDMLINAVQESHASNDDIDEDDDSDDDGDDDSPIQISLSADGNRIITVDLDRIDGDLQVVFNKNNTMYRLNPKMLSDYSNKLSTGLYDIDRVGIKKIGE